MADLMLRPAQPTDFPFLRRLSGKNQPSDQVLHAQIQRGCLRIIELAPESSSCETQSALPLGFLKFTVLWETLPFIEVIFLAKASRHCGLGTQAVHAWEQEMRDRGFDLVLTSSGSDETAQHFWRKLGYTDCGSLTVRNKPAELFLQKRIA
jgi:ribosomal protein S18 acetylase RimI-like enzyme